MSRRDKWQRRAWLTIVVAALLLAGVRATLGAPDVTQTGAVGPNATTGTTAPPAGQTVVPGNSAGSTVSTPPPPPAPVLGSNPPPVAPGGGTAGRVTSALIRNDGGRALFALPNARPGVPASSCVNVTYTGAKYVRVRLYGKTTGTGLQSHVRLRVTRGTLPSKPAALSCSGFRADAANYRRLGKGVIFDGILSGFPNSWAKAYADPVRARATWKKGAKHAYRFEVLVDDDNAAQGLSSSSSFTWMARQL